MKMTFDSSFSEIWFYKEKINTHFFSYFWVARIPSFILHHTKNVFVLLKNVVSSNVLFRNYMNCEIITLTGGIMEGHEFFLAT